MSERAIIAEQSIIGSSLVSPSSLMDVDLSPEEFLNENYKEIYSVILRMISEDEVVDVVTVADSLGKITEKNWLPFIGEMASKTPSTDGRNVKAYANVIREESRIRTAISAATVKFVCLICLVL